MQTVSGLIPAKTLADYWLAEREIQFDARDDALFVEASSDDGQTMVKYSIDHGGDGVFGPLWIQYLGQ